MKIQSLIEKFKEINYPLPYPDWVQCASCDGVFPSFYMVVIHEHIFCPTCKVFIETEKES
jgi:hypothetical protein